MEALKFYAQFAGALHSTTGVFRLGWSSSSFYVETVKNWLRLSTEMPPDFCLAISFPVNVK